MIYGMITTSIISHYLNSYYTGVLISYDITNGGEMLADLCYLDAVIVERSI